MRAYLIDPVAKTVTEVDVDANVSAATIAKMLDCQYIESMNFLEGDVILADEEARLKSTLPAPFRIRGFYVVLGKALIIGAARGEWADVRTPLSRMVAMVEFLDCVPEAAR